MRAARGDAAAWGELVATYVADVWSLSVHVTGDRGEAARVNETVWLRLAQDLPVATTEPLAQWLDMAVHEAAGRAGRPAETGGDRKGAVAPKRSAVVPLPRPRESL